MLARRLSLGLRPAVPTRAFPRRHSIQGFANFWSHVEMGPKDPILGVNENFRADTNPKKLNVGVGAYRTDENKPWTLPSVAEAEKKILSMDHEYAPIEGVGDFVKRAVNLAYGEDSELVKNGRVAAVQSLSGTGALRLAAGFITRHWKKGDRPIVYVPDPTWGNHYQIFEHAGLKVDKYRYWDQKSLGLDLKGLVEDLKKAPDGSVVILHSCAHNPTGVDPTVDQWKEISKAVKEKKHFVIFDNAYQGFASGDADKDVEAVRLFIRDGHNVALCQSFAKNFGLYGERIGCFSIVGSSKEEADKILSQLKIVARAMYSNPPIYGARIVSTVLGDPKLYKMWRGEIKTMADRIIKMRQLLKDNLKKAGSTRNWDHITNQIGMFSYTGLTPAQCDYITQKHHVYLTRNGRISMAGVTTKNVEYLAKAMHDATQNA